MATTCQPIRATPLVTKSNHWACRWGDYHRLQAITLSDLLDGEPGPVTDYLNHGEPSDDLKALRWQDLTDRFELGPAFEELHKP